MARPSKTAQHGFAGCSVASAPALASQQAEMHDTASCQIKGGRGCNTDYKHGQTSTDYFCHSTYSCSYLCKLPYDKNVCLAQRSTGDLCRSELPGVTAIYNAHTNPLMCPLWAILSSAPRISPEVKHFGRPAVQAFARKPDWFCSCAWRAPFHTRGTRLS